MIFFTTGELNLPYYTNITGVILKVLSKLFLKPALPANNTILVKL